MKDERRTQSTGEIVVTGLKGLYEFFIGDLLRIFSAMKEISNYFFIGKTIRKMQLKAEWKKLKLRKGYFNVIYTVVDLPPEVYESEEQYWQMYVIEMLKPTNDWLASWNLQDVVTLRVTSKVDKEQGYYFYLVRYVPIFADLTLGWLIKWALIGATIWWAQAKWAIFSGVNHAFHHLWAFLRP